MTRHLDPARLTTLVVGDLDAIGADLGRFGLGDPVVLSRRYASNRLRPCHERPAPQRQPVRRRRGGQPRAGGRDIWLFLTNPVTVANAVNEGDVSPLVRNLAQVIFKRSVDC